MDNQQPDSEVEIIKVNADEDPDLCRKYNIRSIPTMIFEKNGEVVKTLSGVKPQSAITEIINHFR